MIAPHAVAIVGSRDFPDLYRVRHFVVRLTRKYPGVHVVSGGARGVDQAAEHAALRCGLKVYSFRPQKRPDGLYEVVLVERTIDGDESLPCADGRTFATYGRAAFARNRKIVQHSSHVVAFTTGSRGTDSTLKIANELGVPATKYEITT